MASPSAAEEEHAEKRKGDYDEDELSPKRAKIGNDGDGYNPAVKNMLSRMGYTEGKGLGAHGQGIRELPQLNAALGRHGLGAAARQHAIVDPNAVWDDTVEVKTVSEDVRWIECPSTVRDEIAASLSKAWIAIGQPLTTLRDADDFCDSAIVNGTIEAKAIFDSLDARDIREARRRANPYEEIMGAMFQNRAAMKTANMDRVLDWRLSREFDSERRSAKNPSAKAAEEERVNASRDDRPYYFADVCAGPGGFSEYLLWRKAFYNAKGFGFTLRGKDDFKLHQFRAASSAFFETYYGEANDGDVMVPANLTDLEEYVKRRTNGERCHLVMCDGGFSVDGKEEIQEILSKRLYLCQFIVGLSLTRVGDGTLGSGGNFLCKLFDVFTPFSAGLIYLMYAAFQRVTLHKPHTSRPANSERYIICEHLTEFGATAIKDYLSYVNTKLDKMNANSEDVHEILPIEMIQQDSDFLNYYKTHIESFAKRQILYLNKYREFVKNKGVFDTAQSDLREKCLEYWEIPDIVRVKGDYELPKPGGLVLKTRLGNRRFTLEHMPTFSLNNEAWNEDAKHLRLRDLYAVMLPEYSNPTLLFSNNRGQTYIYRSAGNSEEVPQLILPPETFLLVQETKLYSAAANALKVDSTFSRVFAVVDAALLASDNVASLDYATRMAAARKLCAAVNRGVESWRAEQRRPNAQNGGHAPPPHYESYYLECLEPLDVATLPARLDELRGAYYSEKYRQLAVRSFTYPTSIVAEPAELRWACQSVRFVQRYKANFCFCWSNSNRAPFLFDRHGGESHYAVPAAAVASFYDHFPPAVPSHCAPGTSPPRPLVWAWSWLMDSAGGYGPKEILDDTAPKEELLTRRKLQDAIHARMAAYHPDARVARLPLVRLAPQ